MDGAGTAVAGDAPTAARWRVRRMWLAAAYAVAFVASTAAWGFPASRDRVVLWVLLALFVMMVGRPSGLARLFRDFAPIVVFLYAYDLLRGVAGGLIGHVFFEPQLKADEWLFGGTVPSVTLQQAMWTRNHPRAWDYLLVFVYVTYFIVPFTVAALLWRFRYALFHRYVALWIGLSFAALVTYAVFPAAPPWLAAQHGLMPHVDKVVQHLSAGFNLTRFMSSQAYVNKVAAVPSLHAATALLVSLYFWSWTRRWRWLLVVYPLAMAFALIYLGEHFFSDIALGWIYAVLVFVYGGRLYDRLEARRRRMSSVPTAPSTRIAGATSSRKRLFSR